MQPGTYLCTRAVALAGNVNTTLYNCNLGGYQHLGHAFNCCILSGIVHVYRCTSYDELVRLCSFAIWQSRSLDFTQFTDWFVVQIELSCWKVVCCGQLGLRSTDRFTPITLNWEYTQKSSQISGKGTSRCDCLTIFSAWMLALVKKLAEQIITHMHTHTMRTTYRMSPGFVHWACTFSTVLHMQQ